MTNRVAILGASENTDRYANRAQARLMEAGHEVFPVSRDGKTILGVAGFKSIQDLPTGVDTVTVYVRPQIFETMLADLIRLAPKRAIFNPGTEVPEHYSELEGAGIRCIEACTLVLLSVNQFEAA